MRYIKKNKTFQAKYLESKPKSKKNRKPEKKYSLMQLKIVFGLLIFYYN